MRRECHGTSSLSLTLGPLHLPSSFPACFISSRLATYPPRCRRQSNGTPLSSANSLTRFLRRTRQRGASSFLFRQAQTSSTLLLSLKPFRFRFYRNIAQAARSSRRRPRLRSGNATQFDFLLLFRAFLRPAQLAILVGSSAIPARHIKGLVLRGRRGAGLSLTCWSKGRGRGVGARWAVSLVSR